MAARAQLSVDAEHEETEDRTRFRMLEGRLRQLRTQRQELLDRIHALSDQQKALHDRRGPLEAQLDELHQAHRTAGRDAVEIRNARLEARRRAEEALVQVRLSRGERRSDDFGTPEQLRREIAQLELRQQTTALSLQDENELIGRIRELTRRFADAEKRRSEIMARQTQRQVLEENFQAARAEVERLGHETIGVKNVREAAMARMQGVLVEIGQIVGQIRDLSRQRGRVMDHVDEVTRQINDLERELGRILAQSRARREEARATVRRYAKASGGRSGSSVQDSAADAQLDELMKRGRVTLGG
ncbi:MAG: hypothetical protein WCA77_04425 [Thermoplasmata archaeon]